MRPYLKDFNKRMDSIAIPYKLAQYCKNNVKTYRKGVISDELFYKLIHYALLYIEDCNIRQKSCQKEDVSAELNEICKELNIEVDAYELASDIINHCCENDGMRIVFDATEEALPPFEIRLIDSVRIFKNGRYEIAYELTAQCLDYIYSSKEIAEIGRVSIDQIKLEKAIKAGNFASARYVADSLVVAIDSQKKQFRSKERIIFSNILSLKVDDILQEINDALEMIKSQRRESQNIKKLLDTANSNVALRSRNDNEIKTAFRDIQYIDNRLNYILGLQMNLITVIQEFAKKYREELTSADFITENASLDIMEDIIKPLVNDLKGTVNPYEILIPLFTLSTDPWFNLDVIFKPQPLLKEVDDTQIEIESQDLDNVVTDDNEEITEYNALYENLFLIILNETVNSPSVSLDCIVKKHPEFSKNLNAAKVVLASLLYEKEVIFDDEGTFRGASEREGFYPEILHTKCRTTLTKKKLIIETDDAVEVELEEMNDNLKMKTILKVPNMYFAIAEVQEETYE